MKPRLVVVLAENTEKTQAEDVSRVKLAWDMLSLFSGPAVRSSLTEAAGAFCPNAAPQQRV